MVADPERLRVGAAELLRAAAPRARRLRSSRGRERGRFDPELGPARVHVLACSPRSTAARSGASSGRVETVERCRELLAGRGSRTSSPPRESGATLVSWRCRGRLGSCRRPPATRRAWSCATSLARGSSARRSDGGRATRISNGSLRGSGCSATSARGGALGSRRVLRPRLRAADPADLGRGGLARRSRARGRRREPPGRVRGHAGRAGRRRASSSSRTSAASTASTRSSRSASPSAATRRSRSTTSAARPASAKRDDDFEYMPHVEQTTHAGRPGRHRRRASRSSATPAAPRDLHGRLLLRRPALVARGGRRSRPRRGDRLLRHGRVQDGRLDPGADPASPTSSRRRSSR